MLVVTNCIGRKRFARANDIQRGTNVEKRVRASNSSLINVEPNSGLVFGDRVLKYRDPILTSEILSFQLPVKIFVHDNGPCM